MILDVNLKMNIDFEPDVEDWNDATQESQKVYVKELLKDLIECDMDDIINNIIEKNFKKFKFS